MNFDYSVKKSKGRNIRISISRQGEVFLHVPKYMPTFLAKKFLQNKSDWIEKSLEKIKKYNFKNPRTRLIRVTKEKREEARKLVGEKLIFWQKYYIDNFNIHFSWNRFAIKNTKTRWGSCSSKKNLNFSFRIIFLNESEQDYLIVHELAHLLQMNHSKNFWQLVSLGIPNYKNLRKSLRGI